jgi:hypothetical protein
MPVERSEVANMIAEALRGSESMTLVRQLQGKVRWGTGSPENVVAAPIGTLYLREDGTTGATAYIKELGGSGDTGWSALP